MRRKLRQTHNDFAMPNTIVYQREVMNSVFCARKSEFKDGWLKPAKPSKFFFDNKCDRFQLKEVSITTIESSPMQHGGNFYRDPLTVLSCAGWVD